ncbi:nephrin-like [Homarus americanus]|uniref:nephrin-like n=1 Tax=Homarus americanus TaxID=6706 RepID=UPI001C451BD5|nr:nephrin-like [Homarus americanus]
MAALLHKLAGRGSLQVDPAIQVDRIEPSTSPRRWTVTSQLRVTALAADDGRLFSCQAVHPTLENGPTSLVASVTLSVLHTPGPPIITGYDPSEVLLAGERRTLSCKSSGGNPRPWVLWYRQGRLLDDTTTTLRAGGGVDDLEEVQGVVNDHELAVTPGEDGAVYECRVTSDLLEFPLTSNVTLTVYYAPSSLTIKGLTQVEVGGAVNLTCETSDSNPPASLTWTIQGEVQEHSKSVVGKDGSGGWVTSSHLIHRTVTSNNQSEVTLECRALNPAIQEVIKKTTVVTIIRPAGRPVFEADLNDDLMAGTSLDLTCVSVGGHPPPSIRVFKGEEELATETRTEAGLTRARLEVELTPADNGVEVSCQVDNPALSTPLHTASTLSVLFPPWDVSGRVTPTTVEEGKVATLTCEASSSLPASNITWRSQEARLEGAILTTSPGLFGGTDAR